ncbi:Alpha/beta hydrolase fold-1 [Aspergillus karnatakaensis]|uniref:alpha/beta hydrolase n=1 Tax=Aspergillus karnatakaensis TaxID=1810916 RepID=UPI003CCCA374
MTTPSKAAILLVHGGWLTPAHYSRFTSQLRSLGHEVHVPRLLSVNGARPPNADLNSDTALIRSYAESLIATGRKLIVLMHSYGGQVGTNALAGLGVEDLRIDKQQQLQDDSSTGADLAATGGGVARLVYITAFALSPGQSMTGWVQEMGDEALLPLAFDFADDGTMMSRDPNNLVVGPGLSDEEMEGFVGSMAVWNGNAMHQGIEHCAWKGDIPVSYVCTTEDMTVPLRYQEVMIERMRGVGKEVETFELGTGHCPQVTKAEELVGIVDGIVSGEERRWSELAYVLR